MNWYKIAQQSEFDTSEGIHEFKLGHATIIYQVLRDRTISLSSLRVPQKYRKQGYAKAILSEFTKWMDKEGLSSTLGASPLDRKTSPYELERLYEGFGYAPTGRRINPLGDKEMNRNTNKTIEDY